MSAIIKPPFTEESARQKMQVAEDAWNTRDPERVALAYTENSEWRNRSEFIRGREEIVAFLKRKWARELDYNLKKTMWCFGENRIAVHFEYESHDASGIAVMEMSCGSSRKTGGCGRGMQASMM